jgi:hypothetical protein
MHLVRCFVLVSGVSVPICCRLYFLCEDMFTELRSAALLGKLLSEDATAMPAATVKCSRQRVFLSVFDCLQALRCATLNGAIALNAQVLTVLFSIC